MIITSYSEALDATRFLERFCALPGQVRQAPYRRGLMPPALELRLVQAEFPAVREFWLASKGPVTVARIGASVSRTQDRAGCIGFLEFDPKHADGLKAALLLIEEACQFLQQYGGIERVYSPLQYNTWFPYRYRVEEEDRRYFDWEPVNPAAYVQVLRQAGFVEEMSYHTTAFGDLGGFLEKVRPAYEAALSAGYRFRPFDRTNWFEREIPILHQISHEAFRDNFLFEPISLDVFKDLYVGISDKIQHYSYMVLAPDGREVGFLFAFGDQHRDSESGDVERYVVAKSIAVLKEARGRGLSNALTFAVIRDAMLDGAEYTAVALVRSGIQSESYAKKGDFFWRHRFALFRKDL